MARLAGDDLEGPERAAAVSRLTECPACRRLYDDLQAVRRSLVDDLPSPVRRRDFRLTPADLGARGGVAPRPSGWLGRLLGGNSRLVSPLAGAAVVLGLVLLVSSGAAGGLLSFSFGGSTAGEPLSAVGAGIGAPAAAGASPSAAAPSEAPRAVVTAPAASASAAATGGTSSAASPTPTPPSDLGAVEGSPLPTAAPAGATGGLGSIGSPSGPSGGSIPWAALGMALLVLGALAFIGRWLARRGLA